MNNLTFQPQTFQLLQKHQEQLLNEETILTYNWERRPDDPQELILRNTFLNATDRQVSKFSPGKIKKSKNKKKRVSWNINVQEIENNKPYVIESSRKDPQRQFKDRILQNVRRIMKENSLKGINNLSTNQSSGKSLNKCEHPTERTLTLQKHKSSSLLVSMASLQRTQTLKGKLTSTMLEGEKLLKTVRKERMKTEDAEMLAIPKDINNIESMPTEEAKQNRQIQHSGSLKQKINSRERSLSSKILKTQLNENTQNVAKSFLKLHHK